jgi:hypothetical protein
MWVLALERGDELVTGVSQLAVVSRCVLVEGDVLHGAVSYLGLSAFLLLLFEAQVAQALVFGIKRSEHCG